MLLEKLNLEQLTTEYVNGKTQDTALQMLSLNKSRITTRHLQKKQWSEQLRLLMLSAMI